MASVTTGREPGPTDDSDESAGSSASAAASLDQEAALQALTAHAGEVATEERQQALRAFDDGEVSPTVHRVVSTLAVRVAVSVITPAATAIGEGDPQTAAAVSRLFVPEE